MADPMVLHSLMNDPPKIDGPGLGQTKRSFTKFVDLDINQAVHLGLDVDRKGDEFYVNQFDLRYQNEIIEKEKRLQDRKNQLFDRENNSFLNSYFEKLIKDMEMDSSDLINPLSTVKYIAFIPGLQKFVEEKLEREIEVGPNQIEQDIKKLKMTVASIHRSHIKEPKKKPVVQIKNKPNRYIKQKTDKPAIILGRHNEILKIKDTSAQVPLDFDQHLQQIMTDLSREFPRSNPNRPNMQSIEPFQRSMGSNAEFSSLRKAEQNPEPKKIDPKTGFLSKKVSESLTRKQAELRKQVREEQFYLTINHDQIEKNLRFLDKTIGNQEPFRVETPMGQNEVLLSQRLQSSRDSGERIEWGDMSASMCQEQIKNLRDNYRVIDQKLSVINQDNKSYFHQEFKSIKHQAAMEYEQFLRKEKENKLLEQRRKYLQKQEQSQASEMQSGVSKELYAEIHGDMSKSQELDLSKKGAIMTTPINAESFEDPDDYGHSESFNDSKPELITKSSKELPDPHEEAMLEQIMKDNRPKNYTVATLKFQKKYNEMKLAKIRERISNSFSQPRARRKPQAASTQPKAVLVRDENEINDVVTQSDFFDNHKYVTVNNFYDRRIHTTSQLRKSPRTAAKHNKATVKLKKINREETFSFDAASNANFQNAFELSKFSVYSNDYQKREKPLKLLNKKANVLRLPPHKSFRTTGKLAPIQAFNSTRYSFMPKQAVTIRDGPLFTPDQTDRPHQYRDTNYTNYDRWTSNGSSTRQNEAKAISTVFSNNRQNIRLERFNF